MSSIFKPTVFVTAWIFAAIHLATILGFFLSRRRAVFAIRVPLVVLGCMVCKFICFVLLAWLFLDDECPCAVVTVMLMFEFVGNFCNLLRKSVLLFRYKIQQTLETSKQVGGPLVLDDRNFYVRFRNLLRLRGQLKIFGLILLVSVVGFIHFIFIFFEEARKPCIATSWVENRLSFWLVIATWIYFVPVMTLSLYLTRKLRAFPKDNWRMGKESSITSLLVIIEGITGIITLSAMTNFDGILFSFYCYTVVLQLINLLVPLHLHRQTVSLLARSNLQQLSSLARLLKSEVFLESFNAFLLSEFSSENLAFWLAMERMRLVYEPLLPADMAVMADASLSSRKQSRAKRDTMSSEISIPEMIQTCSQQCIAIARQYIGDHAQWQVNISGATAQEVTSATLHLSVGATDRVSLERALKALFEAQFEVYEGLRKDPFPRYLATPASAVVNQSLNFKRLLAAEKLEQEVTPISTESPRHSRTHSSSDGSHSNSGRRPSKRLTVNVDSSLHAAIVVSPAGRKPPVTQVVFMSPLADATSISPINSKGSQDASHNAGNSGSRGVQLEASDDDSDIEMHPGKAGDSPRSQS